MIAIVYPQFYGVGGIARYLDSFLKNLPDDHPAIYVITGDENKSERHYPGVTLIHIPFSSSRFNLIIWTLKAQRELKTLYRQGKISRYNLHIPPLITGLLLTTNIPMILTAHTTYLGMSGQFYARPYFASQWTSLEIAIKRWIEQRIFRKASCIITLTTQGQQELLAYHVRTPVRVIPNGVDMQEFQPTGVVNKPIDVLFCGRIEKRKGSRSMVEVCQQMVALRPDIRICIVGYGEDQPWVQQQLSPLSQNVSLPGKVRFADMQSYYAKCKIYVSTSYYEGLPGTCLEAMAMGLPAVVWDFMFYQGLVIPKKTGVLVEANNVTQMAASALQTLEDLEQSRLLPSQIRAHVQQDFNWKNLAKTMLHECTNIRKVP